MNVRGWLSFVTLIGWPALSRAAGVTIADGEDWSLPAAVQPKPYSGLFTMNQISDHPLIRHTGFTLTWFDLNPREGVYDFQWVERRLAEAKARGGMVMFRLKSSVLDGDEQGTVNHQRQMIPQWVVDKHRPPTFRTRPGSTYAALWHPGVQAEWRRFILEFGRRGYLASPQCLGVYLHVFSPSRGEEFGLGDEQFTAEAKAAGLTADVLVDAVKFRIDTWREAAGVDARKIAFVNPGAIAGLPYPRGALLQHAFAQGLGWRGGFIEHYYYGALHPPLAGQVYTDEGYVRSDWNAPAVDGRIFSDENEETDEFGAARGRELAVMARSPYFRAAQVGMNFLWVTAKTIAWAGGDEGIAKWFTLVAGKGPRESPDAACWLREARVRGLGSDQPRPWKNLERMLLQRDLPGAMSVPDERYNLAYVQLKDRADPGEFTARRTDVANGQRRLAFRLDHEFRASLGGPVQIKVHYRDQTTATWTIRVATTGGASVDLEHVTGRGDGGWRTATFVCEPPFAPGALGPEVDFAVQVVAGGDVTVRYVRVIR
jgi:hypothetical protein